VPRPSHASGHSYAGISGAHLLLFAVGTGSWCSGLTCQPVTLETAGSNPVEPAIALLPAPSPPGRGFSFAERLRLTHNQVRQALQQAASHQPASHRWGGTSTWAAA
jgi:hypothetical protein